MGKGIGNAFDQMELCLVLQTVKQFLREKWLLLPRNYFDNRISSSNFLLPTFSIGSIQNFQVATLPLATVNFEPWDDVSPILRRLKIFKISKQGLFCIKVYGTARGLNHCLD